MVSLLSNLQKYSQIEMLLRSDHFELIFVQVVADPVGAMHKLLKEHLKINSVDDPATTRQRLQYVCLTYHRTLSMYIQLTQIL